LAHCCSGGGAKSERPPPPSAAVEKRTKTDARHFPTSTHNDPPPPFFLETQQQTRETLVERRMAISGKDLGTSFGINAAVCIANLLAFSFLRLRKPFSLFCSPKR